MNATVLPMSIGLPDFVLNDLAASGLVPEDVNARLLENAERAVTVTPYSVTGYVFPYFDLFGKIRPFYRCRLFDFETKYRQPKDSPNHVYFPKGFLTCLGTKQYIILTEGEKKAAAAVKHGFPCVAFGGVDSWRNKTILISGDAVLAQHASKLSVRLPAAENMQEDFNTSVAIGLVELIDLIVQKKLHVLIAYDTEQSRPQGGCTSDVQRAAAALGFELRFRGVPFTHIRQLAIPKIILPDYEEDKVGIDDFLVAQGSDAFKEILAQCLALRSAFPRHPNVQDYINRRLQKTKISRKETQNIAISVLSDLDSHGMRLRDKAGTTYYFDHLSRKLMAASWPQGMREQYDAPFMQFLYRDYGLSAADAKLLVWLGTQFSGEEPIDAVTPKRVMTQPNEDDPDRDKLYYQLNDGEYIEVSSKGFTFYNNGDNNVLFESDQVDALDVDNLKAELRRQSADPGITCWWASTLSQVRLRDKDKQRVLAALLYYMSPWLFRWRGMQLPVELIVGESGSGKSTLCELRLEILTGRPILRNAPSDIKDWHASVTNTGGLHVTDNVQLVDRTLRQRLSDEICRIVTEPDPFIEQRKLYTNAEQVRIPVRSVFALTAIQQPFQNADLLQRAIILELDKSIDANDAGIIRYDSNWKSAQLGKFGGREAWIAHHLVVLNRFFRIVKERWNDKYRAKHRLINFEQTIMIMADIFGIPASWLPDFLIQSTEKAVSDADWILEGLHTFALEHNIPTLRAKAFFVATIAEWALEHEEFKRCELLINTRKLGKYMKAHKSQIFGLTGIAEQGQQNNRQVYVFRGHVMKKLD